MNKKTDGNRNGIIQKDTETSMDEASKQQGSLKEKGHKKNSYELNKEEAAEVPCTHDEKGEL